MSDVVKPLPALLQRLRYQILLGWLVAVAMPIALSWVFIDIPVYQSTQYITAIGASISLAAGIFAFRRLHIFPGIAAGGYVVMAISATFGVLAIALILLRLDYSRVLLTIIYIASVIVFTLMHLLIGSRQRYRMGVIPGGRTEDLPALKKVLWCGLDRVDMPIPLLDGVVADLHFDHSDAWDKRITELVLNGIPVYDVSQAIEQLTGRVEVSRLSQNTLGALNPNDVFLQIKAGVDVIVAAITLVLLAPLLIVIGLAVRRETPGPALFRQYRTGFRARPFVVYKFRTMRVADPAALDDADDRIRAMTQLNDARITRLGAFLRRTRLDELPQLINVVRGEMSLIGPRPEAIALTSWYEREIPFYHYRHIIKPGITGWAQINQGHVTAVEQVREKLHLDFYYVKNFSFWLDLLIIIRTLQTMVSGSGAR
ncbi:sugar transferase [Sphingomonas sp.]|uniref:sugar transferase n=1 Tax=Sphingomonas sp. TaxID=28214 RepID=UPI00257B7E3C|nr:sugar transferase [Sphingomonas sp.]